MISYKDARKVTKGSLLHVLVDSVEDWGDYAKIKLTILDGLLKDETLEVESLYVVKEQSYDPKA